MHPFEYCSKHPLGDVWALLYSGMRSQSSGEQSLLAWQPQHEIKGGSFNDLANAKAQKWFGYAGYEMLHELETVVRGAPPPMQLPTQWWFSPTKTQTFSQQDALPVSDAESVKVIELQSNLTTERYLRIVSDTIAKIHAGDFYQANITRKFYGRFERAPNAFELFKRLCAISPSPYSAYLQFGDTAILSSSPEGFLQIDATGTVTSRPMKGTAAIGDSTLEQSLKDRSENLMIVDLMRNDLSRCCSDVKVSSLYDVHDFATVRQMISTIQGKRRSDVSALECVKRCFPAGSMTGAPKIAAMRWIAQQEQMQRGVYSGALGWIDTEAQTLDLSVVIRTLIIQGDRFEFQVGGGIVADSDPHKELGETMLKARAICETLGIDARNMLA